VSYMPLVTTNRLVEAFDMFLQDFSANREVRSDFKRAWPHHPRTFYVGLWLAIPFPTNTEFQDDLA
jgi:hypothetical protein